MSDQQILNRPLCFFSRKKSHDFHIVTHKSSTEQHSALYSSKLKERVIRKVYNIDAKQKEFFLHSKYKTSALKRGKSRKCSLKEQKSSPKIDMIIPYFAMTQERHQKKHYNNLILKPDVKLSKMYRSKSKVQEKSTDKQSTKDGTFEIRMKPQKTEAQFYKTCTKFSSGMHYNTSFIDLSSMNDDQPRVSMFSTSKLEADQIQEEGGDNAKIDAFSQILLGVKFKESQRQSSDRVSPRFKYTTNSKELTHKQKSINVEQIINRNFWNFSQIEQQYCRRMNIRPGSKIFIFDSTDLWLKRILLQRGWIQNSNKASKVYHLKWSYRVQRGASLYLQQRNNHYVNSDALTSKIGLLKLTNKYQLQVCPRTFQLSKQAEAFREEFQSGAIHCIVKRIFDQEQIMGLIQGQQDIRERDITQEGFISGVNLNSLTLIDIMRNNAQLKQIKIIASLFNRLIQYFAFHFKINNKINIRELKNGLSSQPLLRDQEIYQDFIQSILKYGKHQQFIRASLVILHAFHMRMVELNVGHYQEGGSKNIWIIKSKNASRGVGTSLSNQLDVILKYQNKIVQKYIQKPLIFEGQPLNLMNKKFDIRVWVLMIGFQPTKIYYFPQFYARIASQKYSLHKKKLSSLNVHLTNYSINKGKYNGNGDTHGYTNTHTNTNTNTHTQTHTNNHNSIIIGQDLLKLISCKQVNYQQVFYNQLEQILIRMGPAINQTWKQSNSHLSHCYFELFGFDFLIDENLKLHLLQVNLSAKCEQRSQQLTTMLEAMGRGMLNLLFPEDRKDYDGAQWRQIHYKLK